MAKNNVCKKNDQIKLLYTSFRKAGAGKKHFFYLIV